MMRPENTVHYVFRVVQNMFDRYISMIVVNLEPAPWYPRPVPMLTVHTDTEHIKLRV